MDHVFLNCFLERFCQREERGEEEREEGRGEEEREEGRGEEEREEGRGGEGRGGRGAQHARCWLQYSLLVLRSASSSEGSPTAATTAATGTVHAREYNDFKAVEDRFYTHTHTHTHTHTQLQAYGAVDPAMHLSTSGVPMNQPLQPLMSVATAIPSRMTTQVLTSPPLSQPQSPIGSIPNPASLHGTPTSFPPGQPTGLQPLPIPAHQPLAYINTMPQGPVAGVMYMGSQDAGIVTNTTNFVPINSPTLQTPMSRLGYKDLHGSHAASFPDLSLLDPLPQPQVNPEHFSKSLAESWWSQAHEALQKQVRIISPSW